MTRAGLVTLSLLALACGSRETAWVPDETGGASAAGPGTGEGPAGPARMGVGDAIQIGALFALKSRSSATETNTMNGIEVAVVAQNQKGGIGGRRIEVVTFEFDGTAQDAERAAREAAASGVVAVLGPSWSNPALAAAPVLEAASIPMIVTLATNPGITKDRRWVFRISSDDRAQAQALAGFAGRDLEQKRYATFVDLADKASLSYAALFQEEMRAQRGEEIVRAEYTDNDTDAKLAADWQRVLAAKPQLVFLPLKVRDVGRLMRLGQQAGYRGTYAGGDGWGNIELLAAGGKAAIGSYFTSHWDEAIDVPESISFFEAYVNLKKSRPTLGAALGYDAARALLRVIEERGVERGLVRDGLEGLAGFPSTTGALRFDEQHSAVRPVVVLRVELSRFVPHRLLTRER